MMQAGEGQHIDLDNEQMQCAWRLLEQTHRSVFLTGRAGTGKSTFLRHICAHTSKRHVVLAPTGIAAVNVGGQTLHSFFKIPFKPLLPDDPDLANPSRLRKLLRYPREKVKLIADLELVIIDEVSMVRADIIDFVDRVLRVFSGNMREPFGGKQLLLVGDVFQLEPVVTRDMRDILSRYYKQGMFFFNAMAFSQTQMVAIELRKVYRQTEGEFTALLDRVREGHATPADMARLNSRYDPDYHDDGDNYVVTLATRRDTVDAINDEHLRALKTPERVYEGLIEGDFPDNCLPTSQQLVLKQGAQVIFIRNDKEGRWCNGTIGKVGRLDDDAVQVTLEDGSTWDVEVEQWENVQYTYNEKEKKVEETVLGSFSQYPIKPAWALTVHKSQGLTFNHLVLDFAGGAFTGGQTYVALSRCTSLEGITLLKPLSERDIIVNPAVVAFSRQFNNQHAISEALQHERAAVLYGQAARAFDAGDFAHSVQQFAQAAQIEDVLHDAAVQRLIAMKLSKITRQQAAIGKLEQVVDSQNRLLHELALEYAAMGDQALNMGGELAGEEPMAHGWRLDDISIKAALANYDKALRIAPDCVEAMTGKAKLMMALDLPDRATALLAQALKASPDHYDAHLTLARLQEQQRDLPAAIKSYKRAARADKTRPEPHDALQQIYEKVGLDDLADAEAARAAKLRKALQKRQSRKGKR